MASREEDLAVLAAFAGDLADAAGQVIRPLFRQSGGVEDKADGSPVTRADRDAEQAMRGLIAARFPAHGIHGEEQADRQSRGGGLWLLDPIDGTHAFITGLPLFTTLIAFVEQGRPLLGVVDQPVLRERWVGLAGEKTRLNGRPVATRDCGGLENARMSLTTPEMMKTSTEQAAFAALRARVRSVRYGADAYAYAMLASGYLDLVLESALKPYDFMALVPVVEGAGGRITDWRGRPLRPDSGPRVLAAATPALHEVALAVLAPALDG